MATYLVSYDLQRPGKDYPKLHEHLRSYAEWAKPLESVWLIKSPLASEPLRDKIRAFMDGNDKILVIDVTRSTAAWYNLPQEVSDWIVKSL